jgi:hypothetical protein
MTDTIHYPEIREGMVQGLKYPAAHYRLHHGIPMDAPKRQAKPGITTPKRPPRTGKPAQCWIKKTAMGRPKGCFWYDPDYGGCRDYQKCLDYAAQYNWWGWEKIGGE